MHMEDSAGGTFLLRQKTSIQNGKTEKGFYSIIDDKRYMMINARSQVSNMMFWLELLINFVSLRNYEESRADLITDFYLPLSEAARGEEFVSLLTRKKLVLALLSLLLFSGLYMHWTIFVFIFCSWLDYGRRSSKKSKQKRGPWRRFVRPYARPLTLSIKREWKLLKTKWSQSSSKMDLLKR